MAFTLTAFLSTLCKPNTNQRDDARECYVLAFNPNDIIVVHTNKPAESAASAVQFVREWSRACWRASWIDVFVCASGFVLGCRAYEHTNTNVCGFRRRLCVLKVHSTQVSMMLCGWWWWWWCERVNAPLVLACVAGISHNLPTDARGVGFINISKHQINIYMGDVWRCGCTHIVPVFCMYQLLPGRNDRLAAFDTFVVRCGWYLFWYNV